MHRLHLLRHAKSDRDASVEDHERPLNRRGREAARRVGASLPGALGGLDLVLCSTSLRTRETAELMLAHFAPPPPVRFEDVLYLAGRAALLRRLSQLDESVGAIMVIGHNPGLHDLALALAAPGSPRYKALAAGKFPTTARARSPPPGRPHPLAPRADRSARRLSTVSGRPRSARHGPSPPWSLAVADAGPRRRPLPGLWNSSQAAISTWHGSRRTNASMFGPCCRMPTVLEILRDC
jgi:phosphohistidine phosphatase